MGISGLCFRFPAPKVNKTAVGKTPRELVEVGRSPRTCGRSGEGDEVHESLVAVVARAASLAASVMAMALDHLRMSTWKDSTRQQTGANRYASALQTHAWKPADARTRRGKGRWKAQAGSLALSSTGRLGPSRANGEVAPHCAADGRKRFSSRGKNPPSVKTQKASGPVLRAMFCPQRGAVLFFLVEVYVGVYKLQVKRRNACAFWKVVIHLEHSRTLKGKRGFSIASHCWFLQRGKMVWYWERAR